MKDENKNTEKPKNSGDAKGKATFDQNGQGAAPKYGQAGDQPNESGETTTEKKKDQSSI